MLPLLVQGGRLFDPGRELDGIGSLLIEGEEISWLGTGEDSLPVSDCDVLVVPGLLVCPGFMDLHCHLREPGYEEKETISTGTLAAARGGFTTVCCMPNTRPPLDSSAAVKRVLSVAARQGAVRVLPVGCITRERAGRELVDMAGLASAGVVGFSDDGDAVADADLMQRALEAARELGLPVIEHCEDRDLSANGIVNEGAVSRRLGVRGIPAASEETVLRRDIELARANGGHLHVAHVSTRGSVELIRRAKGEGVAVTAEVTPHHLILTEEDVIACGASAKVNPPLRTRQDADALIEGLNDGTIDVIATDHAPHTEEEKSRGLELAPFGISGFETALGSLMGLVASGRLSLSTLVAKLTVSPAAILGRRFGRLGSLEVGAVGDVAVIDPAKRWIVEPALFASRGRNTPLAGRTLVGKVVATISRGRLVHREQPAQFQPGRREG